MRVDLTNAELHNIEKRNGRLVTRQGWRAIKAPSSLPVFRFVAGWSIESPFTTEVWHYLVEQNSYTLDSVLYCYTEDFVQMWSLPLGVMPRTPLFSVAVANNQFLINSPHLSAPLYGLPGGGVIQALKTESINPDTTALDLPTGHICSFGDRMCIAQGNVLFFNDTGTDPRTFVAQNTLALAGTVYDLFQATDGALYAFTSAGVYFIPQDAIGKGQSVEGFNGLIPGIQTSRSRNAAVSNGVIAALQRDGVTLLTSGQESVRFQRFDGPRYWSKDIAIEDYRTSGEIFPTAEGFLIGFGRRTQFLVEMNLREGFRNFISWQGYNLTPVGTLRTRENETLIVCEESVFARIGSRDSNVVSGTSSSIVQGVAAQHIDLPEGNDALIRRVTVSADNVGQTVGVYTRGQALTDTVPSKAGDAVIGTDAWSTTDKYRSRQPRSTRHSLAERATHLPVEVRVDGGDRLLESAIDVELAGQGRRRGDKR